MARRSNTVVRRTNTRRIKRASTESLVVAFNYTAPNNESGQDRQRVVAKVEAGSLREGGNGERYFCARNISRVSGEDEGFRTYRLDRVRGEIEIV